MGQFLRGMQQREGGRLRPFWTRRYTKRLHAKVEGVIEEMRRSGVVDNHLKPYLTERPQPSQYHDLARELWWAGCKLP
jgi:hypothetical protein